MVEVEDEEKEEEPPVQNVRPAIPPLGMNLPVPKLDLAGTGESDDMPKANWRRGAEREDSDSNYDDEDFDQDNNQDSQWENSESQPSSRPEGIGALDLSKAKTIQQMGFPPSLKLPVREQEVSSAEEEASGKESERTGPELKMNIFNLSKVHELEGTEKTSPEEEQKTPPEMMGTNTSITEARNEKFKAIISEMIEGLLFLGSDQIA